MPQKGYQEKIFFVHKTRVNYPSFNVKKVFFITFPLKIGTFCKGIRE